MIESVSHGRARGEDKEEEDYYFTSEFSVHLILDD